MNLRSLFILPLLLLAQPARAQIPAPDFQWSRHIVSSGGASVSDLAVNAVGDPHFTGYFVGSITFGSLRLQSDFYTSFFVAKYSRTGNLIWAKQATNAPDGGALGGGIAVDHNGNVYVCGSVFGSSVTFDNTVIDKNRGSIVLVKYDAAGNFVWARQTGSGRGYGTDVSLDDAGNAYIAGTTFVQSTYRDLLLAKYDGAGDLIWTNSYVVNNSDQFVPVRRIEVDSAGNSYLASYFAVPQASIGATILTNRGGRDLLFLKHDRNGALVWAQSAGGTSNDAPAGVARASADNNYVAGLLDRSALFGSVPATNTSGSSRWFVAKYDDSGTCQWVRVAGGTGLSQASAVSADRYGGAYVMGQFNGAMELSGATFSSTRFSTFVCRYEPSGQLTWAKAINGTGDVYSRAAVIDGNNNNLFVAGNFNGTATFGNSMLPSIGPYDIYLAKLHAWPPLLQVSRTENSVKLSWSTNAAGFFLEYRTDLSSTQGWFQGPTPVLEGDRFSVITGSSMGSEYFRLRRD